MIIFYLSVTLWNFLMLFPRPPIPFNFVHIYNWKAPPNAASFYFLVPFWVVVVFYIFIWICYLCLYTFFKVKKDFLFSGHAFVHFLHTGAAHSLFFSFSPQRFFKIQHNFGNMLLTDSNNSLVIFHYYFVIC